jgi:hypothetical protein
MASNITPPNTVSQTNHAMTIRLVPSGGAVAGGSADTIVGLISEWQPAQNRTITDLFAFGGIDTGSGQAVGPGEPFEVVPGNVGGLTINLRRWDLYHSQLETAFGTPDLSMLSAQLNSFSVQEVWARPNGSKYYWTYLGCWFEQMGRQHDAKADRTVSAGGAIRYTRRIRAGSSV